VDAIKEKDDAIDAESNRLDEEASGYADTLNDNHGDDSKEAIKDAANYNAELEKANNHNRVYFEDGQWHFGDYEDLDDYPGKPKDVRESMHKRRITRARTLMEFR